MNLKGHLQFVLQFTFTILNTEEASNIKWYFTTKLMASQLILPSMVNSLSLSLSMTISLGESESFLHNHVHVSM